MDTDARVLAVASHVVYGYVGNKMVTLVLQALGFEVSAINTVNYSNHTAYRQVKGTKATAAEVSDLYEGLMQSNLNNFNLMLSGYMPNAEVIRAVGEIGKDLKRRAAEKPLESFFWALDPVMGDDARLYVAPDVIPAYKSLASQADLILPNKFEAEILSGIEITSLDSLYAAVAKIHDLYRIPHVIVTSVRLDQLNKEEPQMKSEPNHDTSSSSFDDHENSSGNTDMLTVVGSTAKSDLTPRAFRIDVPAFPLFFSGTGDMFAALTLYRLRRQADATPTAATAADIGDGTFDLRNDTGFYCHVIDRPRWVSEDSITDPTQLPLAKAVEQVLASMHAVLKDTANFAKHVAANRARRAASGIEKQQQQMSEKECHLEDTKAAEVRVLGNIDNLKNPPFVEKFKSCAFGKEAGR